MSGERQDVDPASLVAAELSARLRSMGGDEVIELCAQLLTTYVVEGVVPLARGEGSDLAPDAAGEESFAQMLKRLKAAKKDPVLERFIVDGENISVRIDGQGVLPVTGYRRPAGPPPPGSGVVVQTVRRESAPGAAGSIYNRSLYQAEAPSPRPPPPDQQARPAAPTPQPAPGQPQPPPAQKKPEEPRNDRFSLIELE
jgi:hypothetical protein